MGEALLSRLLRQGTYSPDAVMVSEPMPQRRDYLAQEYGVQTSADNQAAAIATEVLLIAVKPQIFDTALTTLTVDAIPSTTLVLSILAGTPLARLEAAFPAHPVVRAMPNTPATVGAGITAIASGDRVQAHHLETAQKVFQAVGEVVQVPEHLMDAVTALSGSGPGYIAVAIEALTDGGVAMGLPRVIAAQLALQTVRGTAELLHETGWHPAELKDRVTSPGGTTIAGIAQLEASGFRSAFIEAVRAACRRSQELGS